MWFPLTLFAVACNAAYALFSKRLLQGKAVDPWAYGTVMQLVVAALTIPPLLVVGLDFHLDRTGLILTILMAVLYAVTSPTYYYAMKHLEVSRLMIILGLSAIFSQFTAAFFLGEPLTGQKLLGASVIVAAVALATLPKDRDHLKSSFSVWDLVAVLNALLWSHVSLLDNYLVKHYYSPLTYQLVNFSLPVFLILLIRPSLAKACVHLFDWRKKWPIVVVTASTMFFSLLAVYNAYNLGGEVSRMNPLLETQTILVVIFGFVVLKERENFFGKFLASLLVVLGVFLMKS